MSDTINMQYELQMKRTLSQVTNVKYINYSMFIEDTHYSLAMTGGRYSCSRGGAAEDVVRLPLHADPGEVQTRGQLHHRQETTHCRCIVFNIVQSHFDTLFTLFLARQFLCCLRSLAAHRDHFVRRLCVFPVVKLSW